MLQPAIQEKIVTYLTSKLNPAFIILFGSYAKGTNRAESDVDLAYLSKFPLSSYERFIIANDLAELVGLEVDLIDIKQIDTVFTMQIFSHGIPIFIQDQNEYMRISHTYLTLKAQQKNQMNDVILNKVTTIERCVNRIQEVYAGDSMNLKDFTKQDSIILNIQRACEASIDLAMHIVSERQLGVPKASRDGFKLLQEAGLLDAKLAKTLMNMVGFRNIAVHDYQALELDILKAILEKHIDDFKVFTKVIMKLDV